MAFIPNDLTLALDSIGGGSLRLLFYKTTDSVATLLAASYFTDARRNGLRAGDLIIVLETDTGGNYTLLVDAVDGSEAATVSVHDDLGAVRNLQQFGAIGDNETDDTAAIQAAVDWAKANGEFVRVPAPSVAYKVTDEIDLTAASGSRTWGLMADASQGGLFRAHFNGYDKAVFKVRDSGGGRSRAPSLYNIKVDFDSAVTEAPVAFDFYAIGNLKMPGCSATGGNNTHLRTTAAFNSDGDDFVSYFGGQHFPFRETDGITFSIAASGTTLTASAPIFEATDDAVGAAKTLLLYDSVNDRSQQFTIVESTGYVSATQVTVTVAAAQEYAAVNGVFEHAHCKITAADRTLEADANCFVAAHVGATLYIQGAGTSGRILKAKIASYTSANVVEIDTDAVTTVTFADHSYFTIPAIAFDSTSDPALSPGITNDQTFHNLHIEDFAGVGLVMLGQSRLLLHQAKIHADASPTDTNSSLANIWLSQTDGSFDGTIEGRPVNSQGMIYASDVIGMMKFGHLDIVLPGQQRICFEENNTLESQLVFSEINVLNFISTGTKEGVFRNEDNSAPRIRLTGALASYSNAQPDFPPNAPNGVFSGWYQEGAGTPVIAGATTAGAVTLSAGLIRWERIGRRVFFTLRAVVSALPTAPVGNLYIDGLPYASVNLTLLQPITVGKYKLNLAAATAQVTAHVAQFTTRIFLFENVDNTAPANMLGSAVLVDTEINLGGSYEIALA